MSEHPPPRGRGSTANPRSRFEHLEIDFDPAAGEEAIAPQTRFLTDRSRSVISTNQSPDVGFDASLNPYRGCEHGCSYCYARPFHEYLGFSAGLDFETRIVVKEDAPELLRQELARPRWRPQVLGLSGVTDPYQPIERQLGITRRCLEVLAEARNPVAVVTKNHLVTRDLVPLTELASHDAAVVFLSLTTLDPELSAKLEPRASAPSRRLAAIRTLTDAGIPTGVLVAPVIPALNDHELPQLLAAAAAAGARQGAWILLRLPHGVAELFPQWLDRCYPARRDKVLGRLREMRGGALYDARYGVRGRGEGPLASQLRSLFELSAKRVGISPRRLELSVAAFRRPGEQRALF